MSDNPLVSCVLTTYNRGDLLKRSLDSILSQTYGSLEVLVINDCSPDNTEEIIKGYDNSRIRYIKHITNQGAAQARNTGMENAKGEFIAFLDDDDEWLPEKIEKQLEVFENSNLSNLGMVSCGIRRINGKNIIEQKEKLRGNLQEKMIIDQSLVGNISCVLIKKSVYDDIGGFDTRWKRGIDSFLFRKISQKYEIDYSDKILVNYYEDANDRITLFQNSDKVRQALAGEFLLLDEMNNTLKYYPATKSRLYRRIAKYNILLNNYRNFFAHFCKSMPYTLVSKDIVLFISYLLMPSKVSKLLKKRRGIKN